MSKLIVVSALLAVALAASGCCCCVPCGPNTRDWGSLPVRVPAPVSELRTEQKSVPVDAPAGPAQVRIMFGGGEFTLRPGARDLLEGSFTYNVADLAPQLESSTQGGVQVVALRPQAESSWGRWDTTNVRNEWDLKLNQDVPMTLRLDLGAFDGSADLGGLRLRALTLNAGACNGTVTFSAANPETMDTLDVAAGAANLSLTGLGNARFKSMTFAGGAGSFVLGFDGAYRGQGQVTVDSGMSKLVIRVPRELGTRVELQSGLSSTRLSGFSQNGQVFTNDSYGKSSDQLTIVVKMAMGDLSLESK